jgi:hypothetical protein
MLGGLGLISSSSFFVPQANLPDSMAAFIPPAAVVPAPVPAPVPVVPKSGSKDSAWSIADIAPYLVGGALLFLVLRDKAVRNFLEELSDFLPVGR